MKRNEKKRKEKKRREEKKKQMMGKKRNDKKEKSEKKAIFCRCPIERKKIGTLTSSWNANFELER